MGFDLYMAQSLNVRSMEVFFHKWDLDENPVKLLFSFAYPEHIEQYWTKIFSKLGKQPCRLMLDSGAFSSWSVGAEIDIDKYIDFIKQKGVPWKWDEVVGLDVVQDAETTYRNCDYMEQAGIRVIPVYHYGEDWKWLHAYKERWPKVGIAPRSVKGVSIKQKEWFVSRCFRELWPFPIHGFGWASKRSLFAHPFDSVDSSSYLAGGVRYGNFKTYKGLKARGKHGYLTIKSEVLAGLKLEREVNGIWKREMHLLDTVWGK